MEEIKPNIHMSEDGEHTDFVAELSITYNGKTKSIKYDIGERCDSNGQLSHADFDKAMRYSWTPMLAYFMHKLKIMKH